MLFLLPSLVSPACIQSRAVASSVNERFLCVTRGRVIVPSRSSSFRVLLLLPVQWLAAFRSLLQTLSMSSRVSMRDHLLSFLDEERTIHVGSTHLTGHFDGRLLCQSDAMAVSLVPSKRTV